jgi:hypothetical protein
VRLLARARLAADFAEGLSGEAVDENIHPGELARIAAFLDGRLSGAERDALIVALTRDASRRADLASAVAVLDAAHAEPQSAVPSDLISRAVNEFAPEKLSGVVSAQPQRTGRWHRRRIMWASAGATLLIAAAVPSAWWVIDQRLDSPPMRDDGSLPSRSAVPERARHTTDQPSPEQSVRQGSPAVAGSGTEPAPASAPLQSLCDDVARSAPDQLPRDGKSLAERRAVAASPDFRPRDPCPPKKSSGAADAPKASTAR